MDIEKNVKFEKEDIENVDINKIEINPKEKQIRISTVKYEKESIVIEYEKDDNKRLINLTSSKEIFNYNLLYMYYLLSMWLDINSIDNLNLSFKQKYRYLKAFIQLQRLDSIIIVDANDMFTLNVATHCRRSNNNNNFHPRELNENQIFEEFNVLRKVELMGCFVNLKKVDINDIPVELKKKIEKKIEKQQINLSDYENLIFICPENIEFFLKMVNRKKRKKILKKEILNTIVFSHELGHLVFCENEPYIACTFDEKKTAEKQANLVSSYLNKGVLDNEIKLITKEQLSIYKDPLLISQRYSKKNKFHKEYEDIKGEL